MNAELEEDRVELAPEAHEWVRESTRLFRYVLEELYPATGGTGRAARRELLLIHVRKGEAMLRGDAPETNAADALRDAVLWLEELQADLGEREGYADLLDPPLRDRVRSPRWFNWALRLLPAVGLSRYAKLARKAGEVNA